MVYQTMSILLSLPLTDLLGKHLLGKHQLGVFWGNKQPSGHLMTQTGAVRPIAGADAAWTGRRGRIQHPGGIAGTARRATAGHRAPTGQDGAGPMSG